MLDYDIIIYVCEMLGIKRVALYESIDVVFVYTGLA